MFEKETMKETVHEVELISKIFITTNLMEVYVKFWIAEAAVQRYS